MRKKCRIIAAVFLCFAILTSVTGCQEKDTYFVKVNGAELSAMDLEACLEKAKAAYTEQGIDFNADDGESWRFLRNTIIEGLITFEIIRQIIEENEWDISDPGILSEFEASKELWGDRYENELAMNAMTEQNFIESIAFRYYVGQGATVSENEIKDYFENNKYEFGLKETQVHVRHILSATREDALVIKSLLNEGVDFTELAEDESIEPAALTTGGDLGTIFYSDMPDEFSKAAFALEEGAISDPVETSMGFHIIQTLERFDAITPEFDDVRDTAKAAALEYKKLTMYQISLEQARLSAEVEYASGYDPNEG